MISLSVNGNTVEVEGPMSIERLLQVVDVPPHFLAVELNENVVAREEHATVQVGPGDRVEVVTLVGGG